MGRVILRIGHAGDGKVVPADITVGKALPVTLQDAHHFVYNVDYFFGLRSVFICQQPGITLSAQRRPGLRGRQHRCALRQHGHGGLAASRDPGQTVCGNHFRPVLVHQGRSARRAFCAAGKMIALQHGADIAESLGSRSRLHVDRNGLFVRHRVHGLRDLVHGPVCHHRSRFRAVPHGKIGRRDSIAIGFHGVVCPVQGLLRGLKGRGKTRLFRRKLLARPLHALERAVIFFSGVNRLLDVLRKGANVQVLPELRGCGSQSPLQVPVPLLGRALSCLVFFRLCRFFRGDGHGVPRLFFLLKSFQFLLLGKRQPVNAGCQFVVSAQVLVVENRFLRGIRHAVFPYEARDSL